MAKHDDDEDVKASSRYTITTPERGAAGTFELYIRTDPSTGEHVASVQFVQGKAVITDELAQAVGFPMTPERVDSEDTSTEVMGPAEALARQIVGDYGYTVTPPLPRRATRRPARRYFYDGVQPPNPAGIPAGADPARAVVRPIKDTSAEQILAGTQGDR